jgi:hypothetical protein
MGYHRFDNREVMQMGFGQKLNQWLNSGGWFVRMLKWMIVITIVMLPIGFITSYAWTMIVVCWTIFIIVAFFKMVDMSARGRAQINAEEYLRVKEEHEAKKRE